MSGRFLISLLRKYVKRGRVKSLGDPVHASTPNQGARGDIAVEDALATSRVQEKLGIGGRLESLTRDEGRGTEAGTHEQRVIERQKAV